MPETFDRRVRQWRARFFERRNTAELQIPLDIYASRLKHPPRGSGDFGSDAVAGNQRNTSAHGRIGKNSSSEIRNAAHGSSATP